MRAIGTIQQLLKILALLRSVFTNTKMRTGLCLSAAIALSGCVTDQVVLAPLISSQFVGTTGVTENDLTLLYVVRNQTSGQLFVYGRPRTLNSPIPTLDLPEDTDHFVEPIPSVGTLEAQVSRIGSEEPFSYEPLRADADFVLVPAAPRDRSVAKEGRRCLVGLQIPTRVLAHLAKQSEKHEWAVKFVVPVYRLDAHGREFAKVGEIRTDSVLLAIDPDGAVRVVTPPSTLPFATPVDATSADWPPKI